MTYSAIQQQFNLAYKLNGENCAYNLVSLCEISGEVVREILEQTLEGLNLRHFEQDVLKPIYHNSIFTWKRGMELVNTPLYLKQRESIRVHIWLGKEKSYLLFIFHHIIFDLRSKEIFANEFSEIYNALSEGREPCLESAHQYDEYIHWYDEFSQSEKYSKMIAYWERESLDNSILNLPFDKERQPIPSSNGHRLFGSLPQNITERLNKYCRTHGSAPFLVLLTAYAVFLHRFSGQDSFSIGVPRTNRPLEEFQNTIGCFVNILPLCLSIDEGMTFKELLRHVRIKMLGMHRNQNIPYLEVVRLNKGKGDAKYNPLFQVGFTFEHPMRLDLNGLEIKALDAAPDAAQLDLFFYFWQVEGFFRWAVEYCNDLFTQERVEGFFASFLKILEEGLDDDSRLIKTIPLIDSGRLKLLKSWNNTEQDYDITGGVIDAFLKYAELQPEDAALIFRGESMTYGELDRRVRTLAAFLKDNGVSPDTIVGLSLERSFEMVVGMYAIVLAGGSYLPIEPTLPTDYIAYIMEDSRLSLVLSKENYRSLFPDVNRFIALDTYDFFDSHIESDFPVIDPDSRVYILYTSGSTGRPKGVEITHRGLINRVFWMDAEYKLAKSDVLFQKTPYNFDVSGWEFWWPLMKGVPLVIAEPDGHKDNSYLIDTIEKAKISIIHFVPSMLREFLKTCKPGNCSSLRDVMCSGEALPAAVVREFYEILPHVRLHNLYGPTEAAIDVTYWPCPLDCKVVPIGRPVANMKIHILDEALNLLPPGVTGEIYLAGVQLARGYLNKPELTVERFVSNPFEGGKMYKTGDLGQWNLAGEILYFGRSDSQVQLHGLRIELGEVENSINDHPAVETAAVILHGEFGADQSLIAYIVKREDLSAEELISYLRSRLPLHMVPKRIIFLEEISLNANGKLDRKTLPEPETLNSEAEKHITMPEGEGENYLTDLWKRILYLEKVGRDENFFDLGGSSIHIIQIHRELSKRFERTIPITDLFIHTTVKGLAGYLWDIGSRVEDKEKLKNRVDRSRHAAHRLKNVRKR